MPAHNSGAARSGASVAGKSQHEPLVHDDRGRVTALCHRLAVPLETAVGESESVLTVLLQSLVARVALPTGVDETPDSRAVAGAKPLDLVPDATHRPDDLVAGHHGIERHTEIVVDEVPVGMTDAAVGDLDHDIVRTRLASVE